MKKVILVLGAAAVLFMAGCNRGGTSDQYNTSSGGNNSSNSIQNGASSTNSQPVP